MSRCKLLLAFAAILTSCVRPRPIASNPPSREYDDSPEESAEYFRQQRVPDGRALPIERYLAAQRHSGTMRRYSLREGHFIGSAATFGAWESLGPGNIGGRTRGLVIHPQNSNIMWIGGATGGVWKTIDAGRTWTPTTDFAPVLTINSLVIDPNNPDTLYAGTGEQTQNWRGAGIFKTNDGGATWSQIPATATPDFYFVNNIAVSRVSSSHIYAATNSGIWATTDGGASWRLSLPSPDGGPAPTLTGGTTHGCFDVAMPAGQPSDVIFAVCHSPGSLRYAIYRNSDAAGSGAWNMVHSDPNMWYTALAVAPSQPSTIYAISVTIDSASAYAKGLLAVYRSTANGDPGTWVTRTSNRDTTRLNTAILSIDSAYNFNGGFCGSRSPNFNGQAGYNLAVAVDPLDPDRVWAAGIGIFRSDDGGANWGYAYAGTHPDQHFLAFDPGFNGDDNQVLYNVNDGGIYKTTQARGKAATCSSTSSDVVWTSLNNGYGATQFYHGVAYPGGAAYFGGTQDNGTVRGTALRGPNLWNPIFGGDGGVSRVDPVNVNTLFIETPHAGLAKSNDGGINYQNAANGLVEDPLNYPFVAYYVFDPSNSLRMYLGGTQLWRTEDAAGRWTVVSAPVGQPDGVLDNIRAVAVSPADPNLVFFGMSRGRVFRNANALAGNGSTVWSSTQPRAGNVSHLEFDPRRPSTIYATYTTFNSATGDGHVYRSLDQGLTWTNIDGSGDTGLPDVPVETLLVDPDDSSRLYAGSDLGVFASFDAGNTWVRDDSPFANAIVTTLSIERNGASRYLYAFTYGRGVWRVPLAGGSSTPCTYTIPAAVMADPNGGTLAIEVATTPTCAWSVTPTATGFASIQAQAFGVGSGKAFLTVPVNRSTSSRSMTVLVQNQLVTVTQPGAAGLTIGDEPSSPFLIPSVPFAGVGTNIALTQNVADPKHTCTGVADFKTGWLRFTASANAGLQVSVQGTRADDALGNSGTVVAVYSLNGDSPSIELGCATVAKDAAGPARNAVVRFSVTRGASYVIETAALSTGAASDNAQLFITLGPAELPPTLDVSPPEALANPGQTRRFQAITSNLPNSAVRWTVSPQAGIIAADGTYTAPSQLTSPATVTVTAQSLADSTLRSTATLTIQPPPTVSLPAPAVTNAASFQNGPVAPGEVVTVFGSSIGPSTTVTAQVTAQGRLSSSLGGTQVLFDNIPAPLVYVTASQVSAIVPYEVAGQTTTQIVVVRNGQSTQPITVPVAAASPALFTASASGAGQAAAVNQDGTLNGPQFGAPPGFVVSLYATGEGQTNPGGINGRLATGIVPQPAAPVTVKVGGVDAEVLYAGAAPRSVAGLLQVNIRIPPGLNSGPSPVVLTVGNTASRDGVTITIR